MHVVIYSSEGPIQRIEGDVEPVTKNVLDLIHSPLCFALAARVLDGTPLSDLAVLADERLPRTLADFDAAFPGAAFNAFKG